MEVQKHPHHVSHKKNWSEYLLEFLMLFLAVFLGFIAENQREHIVEREREKKFASRMLSDLCQDTTFLQWRINGLEKHKIDQAHFASVMTGPIKPTDSTVIVGIDSLLYRYFSKFTTATYDQMKSSGSLRYIRNDDITLQLQKYYEILVPEASVDAKELDVYFNDHIIPYLIHHIRFQDLPSEGKPETKFIMLNRTPESDQEIVNIMGVSGAGWDAVLRSQRPALKKAKELIDMIKKEYHFN